MQKPITYRLAIRARSGQLVAAGPTFAILTEARAAAPVWSRRERLAWRREAVATVEYHGRARRSVLALDAPIPAPVAQPTVSDVRATLAAFAHPASLDAPAWFDHVGLLDEMEQRAGGPLTKREQRASWLPTAARRASRCTSASIASLRPRNRPRSRLTGLDSERADNRVPPAPSAAVRALC